MRIIKGIVIATLLISSVSAQAQKNEKYDIWDVLVGVKAGASAGMLTKTTCDPLYGPYGSIYAEMFFNKTVSIAVEVGASHKGADNVVTRVGDDNVNYQYRFDYINTSYLFKLNTLGQHLALYSGLTVGRTFNAKAERDGHSTDIKDYIHKGEFCVPIGLEWTLGKHFTVDGRWNWSPLKLSDSERASRAFGAARHQFFSLTLGYRTQIF